MQLKEEIALIQRGNQSITEYLHAVKALADEIAIIDELTLYVLHGLGFDFLEIAAPIRARENTLAFEELHDLLVGHHNYLRRKPGSAGGPAKNFPKSNGPNRNNGQGCCSQHGFSCSNNNQQPFKPKC
ncbi:hypothetical protein F2P56_008504 [Juglans regia]|uniref:Retrotransposon gag domain-containing protein n=1 Tax=Juglans regia TaxID=51240 RepID=A0A833XN30_JUGRE|nr:hypothetical protein F2P56_008504 [Juglans regia]